MVLDLNEMPAGEVPASFGGSSHHGCHGVPFHGPWATLTPAQLQVLYNMVEVPVNYHRIHHFVTHQANGRTEHSWISWPPSQQATRRGTMIHPFKWANLYHGIPPTAHAPLGRPPVAVAPADAHTSPFLSMMEAGWRSSVRLEELDSSSDDTKIIDGPITVDSVPTRRRSSVYRQNQHQQAEHIGSSSQQGAKNHVQIEDIRAPPPTQGQPRPAEQIEESVPPAPKGNYNNRGLQRARRRAQQQKWTAEHAAAHHTPVVSPALPPRHPCNTSQVGGGAHRSSPSLATVLSVYNQRRPTPIVPTLVPAPMPAAALMQQVPMVQVPVLASCSVPSSGKKRPSPSDIMSAPVAGSPKFKLFKVEIDVAAEKARHANGRHIGHGIVNPLVAQSQSGGRNAPPVVREENRPPKLYKPMPRRCNTTDEWSPYRMFW